MDAGNWRDGASNSQLIILHSVYLTTFRMSNKLNNQNYRFNKKLDLSWHICAIVVLSFWYVHTYTTLKYKSYMK